MTQGGDGSVGRQGRSDGSVPIMPGVPAAAGWLGLSGLLPFFAGALLVAVLSGPTQELAMQLLAGYGAVILSFMGGCRWGFAAAGLGAAGAQSPGGRGIDPWFAYGASVVPSLYAWLVLMVPDPWRMALLALGFLGLMGADYALTARGGAPVWWPALRLPLSLGAAGSLLFAALFG
ncbi:MAG: DUF3429 domain-containing protein [Pseudomonadota bacterium]